jgi:hypothetical protein
VRDAEREVLARSPDQDEAVRLHTLAADARVKLAKGVRAPARIAAAAELLGEAVRHRVLAFVASTGRHLAPDSIDVADLAGVPVDRVIAVRDTVTRRGDELVLERRGVVELAAMMETLLDVERRLRSKVESRSLARLRCERIARCAGAILAALYLLLLGYKSAFGAPNVAFHKHVTLSAGQPVSAARLVDGVRDSRDVDALADPAPEAWMDVDLGGVYALDRVVVTNRTDKAFDGSLPLSLEVSTDGRDFTLVELRRLHFTRWVVEMHGARALHVRVRSKTHAPLGLNELELFGRYATP